MTLPGQWKGRAWHQVNCLPSTGSYAHCSYTLMLIYFILSHFRRLRTSTCHPPTLLLDVISLIFSLFYEHMLLTTAGAGGTYSGWKICISQASHLPQKCLNGPHEGIENHLSLD